MLLFILKLKLYPKFYKDHCIYIYKIHLYLESDFTKKTNFFQSSKDSTMSFNQRSIFNTPYSFPEYCQEWFLSTEGGVSLEYSQEWPPKKMYFLKI